MRDEALFIGREIGFKRGDDGRQDAANALGHGILRKRFIREETGEIIHQMQAAEYQRTQSKNQQVMACRTVSASCIIATRR